jgi:CubicO group peptidase (beta-lactamase class C family)
MAFTSADAARIADAAQATYDELGPSGFSVGVVDGQDLVFAQGYGFADIESGRRQHPDLRQRIGSITKTMVGLCTMALVDEGRLNLDDRLADHVPEVAFHGEDGGAIRLRHLLTHTSGIGEVNMVDEITDPSVTLWSDGPDKDLLGLFPRGVTLQVRPETKWSYANLGFALLGEVVARAERAPIGEVLQRRVFGPLGMGNSDLDDLPHPDLTTGYHWAPNADAVEFAARDGRTLPEEPTVDGRNIRGAYQYIRGGGAAGAVQSTIPDMARYAAGLLRQGAGIVRPETFAAMTSPQWSPDPRLMSWGLSFDHSIRHGRKAFGHGGGVLGGWNTMLIVLPEDDKALLVHSNTAFDGFEVLNKRLLAALLDAPPAPRRDPTPDPRVLEAAPGVYEALPGVLTNVRIAGATGRLQIKAEDGRLRLYARRGPWKAGRTLYPADPADPGFFVLDDDPLEPGKIALIRDEYGQVTGLRCDRLVHMQRAEVPGWA